MASETSRVGNWWIAVLSPASDPDFPTLAATRSVPPLKRRVATPLTPQRSDVAPYVHIRITREGATDRLYDVLGKGPATTFVVIDEVEMEDWGIAGLPVAEYRRKIAGS